MGKELRGKPGEKLQEDAPRADDILLLILYTAEWERDQCRAHARMHEELTWHTRCNANTITVNPRQNEPRYGGLSIQAIRECKLNPGDINLPLLDRFMEFFNIYKLPL